uniref:Tryptophan synthase beta chain-like PALP domain-containing protein n=1 Tax=Calcidiscus leptoporus TaxID=127549 RepID=A0A7S0JJI8_9EUKA|mmetsp:Transcript_59822/g.137207  ORF Transcript_59822/g.137207 Transcript_59822/m.137207 type:complete len:354 (+) Transcript_59822:26-1087(+)
MGRYGLLALALEYHLLGIACDSTPPRTGCVLPSAMHAIHGTPCVELSRLAEVLGLDGRIIAKLEYISPGFSKKDRIARQMIEEARADGSLCVGQPVIELTSGNTGTGLAIVCATLGHPFIAVMSRGNSIERARMMASLGAEVVLVDQCEHSEPGQVSGEDLQRVFEETARLTRERGAFRADQFTLAGNARAHAEHTGPELLLQARGSGYTIDGFVDFVGSGGTFAGVATALRVELPRIRCYVVEPHGAAVLSGRDGADGRLAPHKIQGGGYGMAVLASLGFSEPPDGYLEVTSDEATEMARLLARSEGIFAGFSGGANVAAAVQLLRGPLKGGTIACMICDSGLKYLSTDLWP